MPKLAKASLAVLVGLTVWFVVATVGNLFVRALLPGYEAVEKEMNFSLLMQVARLVLGLVSSLSAGLACAWLWRGSLRPAFVLGALLLALFIPVHIGLWSKFPIWYHAVFLVSLVPATLLGFRFRAQQSANAA
jgi:ABC-type Mn2+/Zn2+ transport system permease subunit